MKKILIYLAAISLVACSTPSNDANQVTDETSQEPASKVEVADGVSFVNIQDGAELTSPFVLEMGVQGMQVEPKGAPRVGWGHHHLLINDGPAPEGTIIVADETHVHYGGGQTSDSVKLAPGNYKLTMQFADGMHVSYGEKWAKTISVTVK
jgi:hypothetical protein